MYFECIGKHANKGMIVKFTKLGKGLLIKEAKNGTYKITTTSKRWTEHTDKKAWKQVNFDETICKIIPTQDDIDELISDLKSIIEDDDNRFSPSEYGAGTKLKESGYDQCRDLIDEWMDKYHITKAPEIKDQEDFKYYYDLVDIAEYIKGLLSKYEHKQNVDNLFELNPFDEYVLEKQSTFLDVNFAKDDTLDALSYAIYQWNNKNTGATEVVNNLNQTKEFTMTKELQEAILELIAANGKPKVKKPKTPKIVCNVNGDLMEFADEAALKSFMWSSRVESVIRYDLSGKVTVPFELSVEAPTTKASK